MFSAAPKFNQNLSSWDVRNVRAMQAMFRDTAIDCDLSGWDVRNVRTAGSMFDRCPLEKDVARQPKFPDSNMTK